VAGGVTVGIDIGTTSVKAVAADGDGTVLARARIPHEVHQPEPGSFEHDPDQAWRADVVAALAVVSAGLDVAAVDVSAMVPSLAAVRADGTALGPGLLYGDRRGEGAVRDGSRDESRAGDSGELLAFLAWQSDTHPEAAGFWPAQAVANHALTGRGAIDTSTAMTALPLFDGKGWDAELAAGVGATTDALPSIVSGSDAVGPVQADLPAAGAQVGGGTIDAMAEQIVAGADEVGDVLVLCGTTLITWGVIEDWQEAAGLWTIPHTARGRMLVGGPSNAGGLFLNWATGLAGKTTKPPAHASRVPVWAPYPRGERSLLADPHRRAELHGLDLTVDAAGFRRSAFEASGFVTRRIIERSGVTPRRIVATGGGVRVPEWTQALADATGLPVDVVAVPEGAALGAAWMARMAAGLESSMGDAARWARVGQRVEPDPRWRAACDDRYGRFLEVAS
jgi:xylulokinase